MYESANECKTVGRNVYLATGLVTSEQIKQRKTCKNTAFPTHQILTLGMAADSTCSSVSLFDELGMRLKN